MYPSLIEFAAVVLFLGGVWHAARHEGVAFAQQWFIAGYLFGITREMIVQIVFPMVEYAPRVLRLGAAPALISLLWGAIFYLAYRFALRLAGPADPRKIAALMFVIAASLILPIEATAAQWHWWVYADPAATFFGGVPPAVPLIWGGTAALYYAFFARIAASRLPDRGRLYAMISFSPVIVAIHLVYTIALTALVG